jgi:hypothetical protein
MYLLNLTIQTMRHQTLKMFAWLAVLSIVIIGDVFAQVPSIVTQQTRLSTGGATPSYVQLRAKSGIATSTNFYAWDQAPNPTPGTNYSLWLNEANEIVRSNGFGVAEQGYLLQVNATGNGLQWVNPASLTALDGDIHLASNANEVNVGHTGLDNRLIQAINDATGYDGTSVIAINRGGTNSQAIPTAGAVAVGDGTKYQFTAAGSAGQVLSSTGAGTPVWIDVPSLLTFDNALTQDATTHKVQFGGPLVKATSVDQANFSMDWTNGTMNFGSATTNYTMNIDLGTGGNMTLKNVAVDATAPNFVTVDASGNVRTRPLSSLVVADNGLTVNATGGFVELGAPATGGATLLVDRFVSLNGKTLNFEGAGTFNIGDGTNNQTINVDPKGGALNMKSLTAATPATTDRFVVLDGTDKAFTRTVGSLVDANNGLTVDKTGATDLVQLGGPLIKATAIDQATFAMDFTNGTMNLGSAAGTYDINVDLGNSASHNINIKNVAAGPLTTTMLTLDATGNVRTRDITTLVVADNGLTINATGGFVELGSAATGGAPLLVDRFVALGGKNLNFEGTGNFNIGDGTNAQNITLDPGAAGSTNFKNLAAIATPAATDRFVVMTGAGDKAFTRTLTSLVDADNGLIVNNTSGTTTVQLGAPASGGALLLTDRFIGLHGFKLNYEGDGDINMGSTGNVNVNVNTGATGNMTLQGTTLNVGANTPGFDNIAFVDAATHNVRDAKTSDLTTNATPTMFMTLDASGNITKSISPTSGIAKGKIAGNGNFQYTSPVITGLAATSAITCTVENNTGVTGAIVVQIRNVNTSAGTFDVETSESIQTGSSINYTVIN